MTFWAPAPLRPWAAPAPAPAPAPALAPMGTATRVISPSTTTMTTRNQRGAFSVWASAISGSSCWRLDYHHHHHPRLRCLSTCSCSSARAPNAKWRVLRQSHYAILRAGRSSRGDLRGRVVVAQSYLLTRDVRVLRRLLAVLWGLGLVGLG